MSALLLSPSLPVGRQPKLCAPFQEKLSQMDVLVLMTAAICHDLDHPGYNNTYVLELFLTLPFKSAPSVRGDLPVGAVSRGLSLTSIILCRGPGETLEPLNAIKPHRQPYPLPSWLQAGAAKPWQRQAL